MGFKTLGAEICPATPVPQPKGANQSEAVSSPLPSESPGTVVAASNTLRMSPGIVSGFLDTSECGQSGGGGGGGGSVERWEAGESETRTGD